MDKMYCLSSAEALTKFVKSPRTYLLPPHPRIPCKICIAGPPTSGKTTLAQGLANHYNAMVYNNLYMCVCILVIYCRLFIHMN